MKIDGLTTQQCKMLDIMWEKDTQEELVSWFQSLTENELEMALTLHDMLMQEVAEEQVEKGTVDARNMLAEIGINV